MRRQQFDRFRGGLSALAVTIAQQKLKSCANSRIIARLVAGPQVSATSKVLS
jgi:hypothetical protein